MITVKITGGLGNQLFQYAAARSLAIKLKTDVILDISEFKIKKHRQFLLHKFNIKANYADQNNRNKYFKFSFYLPDLLQRKIHMVFAFLFDDLVYEKMFTYDAEFFNLPDNIYLIGFWQSPKYFKKIYNLLLNEITLKKTLSAYSRTVLHKIKHSNSVSVNFRRGDFVTDPQIHKRHGVLSLDYYQKAVNLLSGKIKNPHFFLFSDDINWVKKNWTGNFPATFVENNYPNRQEEDLVLGSRCQHHILANSTFSWWTAFLNNRKDKQVIAPVKWFDQLKYDTYDLFPKEWLSI